MTDKPPPACPFTAMIAVGPADYETPRLVQLLEALYHYEPGVSRVVLIDDAMTPRDLLGPLPTPPASCSVEVVKSPRQGRGEPRMGGGTVVMLTGIKHAATGDVGRFLVKLDTDALIVAPFSGKLAALVDARPDTGIVGACYTSPNGKPRGDQHHRRVFGNATKLLLPHGERKSVGRRRRFPTTLKEWRLLRITRRAKRAGCTLGENVAGGAYAVTGEAIKRIKHAGLLDDVELWLETFAIEDGVIPLYAKMLGLTLVDHVKAGEVFGVVYRGLPAMPDEIVSLGYSIVHCTKNDERVSEADIYAFFAERRNNVVAAEFGSLSP